MRIVLFGSGSPASAITFEALAPHHDVAAVVIPSTTSILRRFQGGPLIPAVKRQRIPIVSFADATSVVAAARPDVLCVASFPHLLQTELLQIPKFGGLNVHPSLLPRHKGPNPIFWTYVADDSEGGVTIHQMTAAADEGPIVAQERVPLGRGQPVEEFYLRLAEIGARLTIESLLKLETKGTPVVDALPNATSYEPSPIGFRIDFATWPAERAWHVLKGLGGMHHTLLADSRGRPILHGRARSFDEVSSEPGRVEKGAGWIRIHCLDGRVEVEPPSMRVRASQVARSVAKVILAGTRP